MANEFELFDSLVTQEDERRLLSVRGSVLTGMDSNPDQVAQALPLAQQQNLPLQTVEKNMERVRKNGMDNDFFDNLIKRSPSTADFLSTLDNAKIAHDEIGFLEGIEKTLVDTPKAYAQGALDLELNKDIGQKIISQNATKRDLAVLYYANKDRRNDFGTGGFVSQSITSAAETLPMTISSTGNYLAGYGGGFLSGTALAFLFGSAGPQVGTPEEIITAPTLGHTLGTVGGTLASGYDMFLAESGAAAIEMQNIRDENGAGLDPDTITGTAVAVGLVNSGLEMVSLKALTKTLPGGEEFLKGQFSKLGLRKLLKDQAARDTFRRIGASYMKSIGTEVSTEALQEFTNIAGEELAKLFSGGNFESATVSQSLERVGDVSEKAFYASVGLGFPGTVIRSAQQYAQRNNTVDPVRLAGWASESAQAVRDSKLLARSPQKFREYMGKVLGDKKFFMNAEQAERFFQSVTPEQQEAMTGNIAGFAQAIEQARLTGGDVEISQADYFSYVVPLDQENRLAEYVKMSPEEYSVGELRDSEGTVNELLDGLAQEESGRDSTASKAEAVEQRYYEQLLNTGQTPDAARLNALRLRKAYETFSARYGERSTQAQDLIDRLLGQLSVERKFRDMEAKLPVNHMDLFLDRARGYVEKIRKTAAGDEKRRQTAIKKAEDRARATGRPYKPPRFGRRTKSHDRTRLPVLDFLAQRGGVKPGSPLAQELRRMDVTPKNAGWLFKDNGIGAADNIDFDAFPATAERPAKRDDMQDAYVDQAYILDQVREELFGNPIYPVKGNPDEEAYGDFLQVLDDMGIDILTASNDDIKKALQEAQARYKEGGQYFEQGPTSETAAEFSDRVSKELGVDIALNEGQGILTLSALKVLEGERGQGVGTQAMRLITEYADRRGLKLALTPTKDFGASSVKRLVGFYKRFGFVNNKGRNKDFTTREAMIREPAQVFFQDEKGKGSVGGAVLDHGKYKWTDDPRAGATYQKEIGDGVFFEVDRSMRDNLESIPDDQFSELEFEMRDAADTYLNQMRQQVDETLRLYGLKIYHDERSRQSFSEYWSVDFDGKDDADADFSPKKIRFSDHGDHHGGSDLLVFWGETPSSIAEQVAKLFGVESTLAPDDPNNPNIFNQPEGRRGPRGSIEFFSDQARISLYEGSDLSTIIHEEGHLYWNLLQKIAGLEEAKELFPDAQKDVDAVRDWVGAKEGQKLTLDQEEKIARGFEAYLLKGESPSMDLKSAFQRFKAWLSAIYKEMQALNVNVSAKVSAVFDRMLAADEEIEALADNVEFKADEKILSMLTEAEKAKYLRNQERAMARAKDKIFAKALRQAERTLRKWWKEERARVRDETQKRVESSPLYRLTDFLQKGIFRDAEGNLVEGMQRQKLNRKAVLDRYGKEVLPYLPRGILSDQGLSPEALAEMFGFDSSSQMIDGLMRMEDKAQRIERLTDEDMQERHGDMLNDGTIQREAQEAFTNEFRQYVLELELKTLAKAAKMAVPQGVTFKIKAEQILDSKQVRELIPYRFYRSGIKAARAAGVAIGKEDFVTAVIQKQKQLLNHHLYRISSERKTMLEKKFRKWDKLTKQSDKKRSKTHDIDYIYAARAILARNGIGRSKFNFTAWMDNLRLDDPDTADLLQHAIDTFAQEPKDYRTMEWQEFLGLADAIDNILGVAKQRRTVVINGKKTDLDEAAAIVRDTIEGNLPAIRHPMSPRRDRTQAGGFIRGIVGVATKVQTYVEKMDGGQRFGAVYQALRDAVTQGEVKNALRQREEAQKLKMIFERHFGEIVLQNIPYAGDYTATFEDLGETGLQKLIRKATFNMVDLAEKIYVPEINEALTREQILAIALNYGNEDNITKLKAGMKVDRGFAWEDAQVDAVLRYMRKKDWLFVQEIWDLLESYWPETVALDRRTVGYAAPKVQPRPFTVKTFDGQSMALRGGYYPLKYDSLKSGRAAANEIDQTFKEMRTGKYSQAKTRRGRTKERVENVEEPVRLDLDVITDAVKETVTDLTMREPIENTRKILAHKDVRTAIEQTMGPEVYQSLEVWLQDTAVGGMFADGEFGQGLRGLRHSLTISAMGFKVATTLLQPTGLIQSITEVGSRWISKGFYRYMTAGRYGPLSAAVQVQQISPFMRTRAFTMTRDVADSMRRLLKGGIVNDTQGLFFVTIQKTQQIVDTITWLGAYEKATVKEGLEGDHAVRYADLAVETSQGSGFISSLAPIERGTVSATSRLSEGWKTWTVFYSYFNAKINVAMRKTQQTDFRNPYEAAKLAGDYIMLFWLETLIGNAILGRLPDFEDEDDEDKAAAMFSYMMGQGLATIASGFPVISNFAGNLSGFSTSSGAARGIEDIAKGVKAVYNEGVNLSEGEDVNWFNIAQGVNTAGVYLSPYKWPAGQINVALRAAERKADGEEVAPIDYFVSSWKK